MADQELRDRSNRLLGKIKQRSDGKLEGRDASNRLKGTYDPKRDETRDSSNRQGQHALNADHRPNKIGLDEKHLTTLRKPSLN